MSHEETAGSEKATEPVEETSVAEGQKKFWNDWHPEDIFVAIVVAVSIPVGIVVGTNVGVMAGFISGGAIIGAGTIGCCVNAAIDAEHPSRRTNDRIEQGIAVR